VSEGRECKGEVTGEEGVTDGSGGREGRGPMKSVNFRARKAASPPLGKRAVATGNARG